MLYAMNTVTIYTDGASRGNPGPGGWAAIIIAEDTAHELSGYSERATNNQMELQAVIEGLSFTQEHHPDSLIVLHSDSTYVLNGLSQWLDGWVRNNWITSTKKPVENKDLWQQLLLLRDSLKGKIKLEKVKGHSGHVYNDRCDELAVQYALKKNPERFEGSLKAYENFLKEFPPSSEKKPSSGQKAYSYVSLVENTVYVDATWQECEKRVKGKANAKYKKVYSKAEETSLIQDYTLQSLL